MSEILYRTENIILERELRQKSGELLAYADLTNDSKVFLFQGTLLKRTLGKGTADEVRQGSTANHIAVELTTAILAALSPGELRIQWHTEVADAAFVKDGGVHRDDHSDPALDYFELL